MIQLSKKLNDQPIAFYFDACVQVVIAKQLTQDGVDAVTARDLNKLRDDDDSHLQRATEQNRVLVTYDDDFVKMAHQGVVHSGIVFVPQRYRRIGIVVKGLSMFHDQYNQQEVRNLVWYLSSVSSS